MEEFGLWKRLENEQAENLDKIDCVARLIVRKGIILGYIDRVGRLVRS